MRTKIRNKVNVLDLTEYLTSQQGYIKSSHTTGEYDGGIFISNKEMTYFCDVCESLIDSHGNHHNVIVRREERRHFLSDEDFMIRDGAIVDSYKNIMITTQKTSFQFNLRRYLLINPNEWYSSYERVRHILQWGLYNKTPFHYYNKSTDAMRKSEYAPFYEICYCSNNHHYIENYIPDEIFFNYLDKHAAATRVQSDLQIANEYLNKMKYESIEDDKGMVNILNDRFNKQIRYISYLQTK